MGEVFIYHGMDQTQVQYRSLVRWTSVLHHHVTTV
jgi:hypothetical protein